jgi:hypothetical protein
MIDEVDKASNHTVFLHFLGMLRNMFLERKSVAGAAFHSVILAGVHDIKNIKSKMVSEGTYTPVGPDDKKYDSPWNIATNFNVDMSFSPVEISTMLTEYEDDHNAGIDVTAISEEIYNYTSGYPFLISRICQCIDEELGRDWTTEGIQRAIKILLTESNTLFDDMFKNLENNKELSDYLYTLLILGESKPFIIYDPIINVGVIYGFVINVNGIMAISNKIFELTMINYYISKDLRNKKCHGEKRYNFLR